jgi:site-specific DNA-methyltransferase (cytosine-N4-specific)
MLIGDVFDVMAGLPDGDFDLICTSPPFWRQRAYLPADHPDKSKEIGQESTPAEYVDVMLRLTAEWRRLLSPYGSLVVEMGDTMAGSGGDGQPRFVGSAHSRSQADGSHRPNRVLAQALPKSHCNIPELYRTALVYGDWPILTGNKHQAGRWIQRNDAVWCRPNPTPGDDSDKFRRATSDIMCFTLNPRRWWDGEAVRVAASESNIPSRNGQDYGADTDGHERRLDSYEASGTRPLYDWWDIAPYGYSGAHYAVWTPEIARRLILTMCPAKVCRECGEPSRRIVERTANPARDQASRDPSANGQRVNAPDYPPEVGWERDVRTVGWSDCGHNAYRAGRVLDPFGGSGTTAAIATGHGRHCTLIDIDSRNADLAMSRVGMLLEVAP